MKSGMIAILIGLILVLALLVLFYRYKKRLYDKCKTKAEQGDADAQNNLGKMHADGRGTVEDYKKASKVFLAAVGKGYVDAQFNEDCKEASKVLLAAARKGHADAQFNKDYKKASKWFLAAAKQGHADAQFNLGRMHENGQGVLQDYKEAVKRYLQAAEQGHALARNCLGSMYAKGRGVPQNNKEALKWWQLSAEQGDADAQFFLGLVYAHGWNDVSQNYVMAHMFFNLAASNGHEDAASRRDFLADEMSDSEIEKAQDLAREWMSEHAPQDDNDD